MKSRKYIVYSAGILIWSVLAGKVVFTLKETLAFKQNIRINEVCSFNESLVRDDNRNFRDYIELYNVSNEGLSLEGWHLSDDKKQLDKAELSDVWIESKGFFVFYANGENEAEDSLPFRLDSEGETIYLSDPEGNLVDSVIIPKLKADTVYARKTDGTGEWARMEPSPEKTNGGCQQLRNPVLEKPVFSQKGGFYKEPFALEITANLGETIYYTLDGSDPTEDSNVYIDSILIESRSEQPNVYTSIQNVVKDWKNYEPPSEPVDKAVVVRAVAMDDKDNISEIVTATYFVALEQYEDEDVLSVVAEPDALFGEDGIYVTGKEYDDWYLGEGGQEEPEPNFLKGGRRREIEGSIEFYESGSLSFNQSIGLRIQGESARQISKKRFSIFARRAYEGSDYLDRELFEGSKSHSVVLREGFANAVIPCLLTDRHMGVQSARPVTVFLNGEYWYTTYIQEKFSSRYLSEKYGVDRKNIFIIKNAYVDNGKNSDINYYLELLDYFEQNDFSTEEAYEEAGRIIDIQSYIDFFCANIYLGNVDMWEGHNYVLWRSYEDRGTRYEDGRWRWLLYDLDCAGIIDLEYYGLENHAEIDAFSAPMRYSIEHKTMNDMSIFAALRNNEEFKKQFVLTFMDMANTNFSFRHVEKVLRAYGEDMNWHDGFFLKRFDYAVSDLAEEFSLHGTLEELTVKIEHPEAGSVQVNTCMPDFSEGVWTGKYYTDYPVTLQAVPSEGYVFAGWKGDVSSKESILSVDLKEGAKVLEAVFERRD